MAKQRTTRPKHGKWPPVGGTFRPPPLPSDVVTSFVSTESGSLQSLRFTHWLHHLGTGGCGSTLSAQSMLHGLPPPLPDVLDHAYLAILDKV